MKGSRRHESGLSGVADFLFVAGGFEEPDAGVEGFVCVSIKERGVGVSCYRYG